jgi:hypothetical protein
MRFSLRPRIVSALVLIGVINVYVFAAGAVVPNNSTSESASPKVLLGKLITTSNRPILVNGAEAITGTRHSLGCSIDDSCRGLGNGAIG